MIFRVIWDISVICQSAYKLFDGKKCPSQQYFLVSELLPGVHWKYVLWSNEVKIAPSWSFTMNINFINARRLSKSKSFCKEASWACLMGHQHRHLNMYDSPFPLLREHLWGTVLEVKLHITLHLFQQSTWAFPYIFFYQLTFLNSPSKKC